MHRTLRGFLDAEDGQDLVEYSILAALIATVSIVILNLLGRKLPLIFASIVREL